MRHLEACGPCSAILMTSTPKQDNLLNYRRIQYRYLLYYIRHANFCLTYALTFILCSDIVPMFILHIILPLWLVCKTTLFAQLVMNIIIYMCNSQRLVDLYADVLFACLVSHSNLSLLFTNSLVLILA